MRKRTKYISTMVLLVTAIITAAILTACSLAGARSCIFGAGESERENGAVLAGESERENGAVLAGGAEVKGVTLTEVPEYDGEPSVEINGNVPSFSKQELEVREDYQNYGTLDELGRCTLCEACVSKGMMPESDVRADISDVHPSGWMADQGWERCHLIARCLTAQEGNVCNLITGTHYMNVDGMLPYELEVANYVRDTGNHVMYRVTPIYDGDNQVASGVQMEAQSIEDDEICFNVYCYNLYPDEATTIDYMTGKITREDAADGYGAGVNGSGTVNGSGAANRSGTANGSGAAGSGAAVGAEAGAASVNSDNFAEDEHNHSNHSQENCEYILNTNTMRIHAPSCKSVKDMADHNKKDVTGKTIEELEKEGYKVCGNCHAGQR